MAKADRNDASAKCVPNLEKIKSNYKWSYKNIAVNPTYRSHLRNRFILSYRKNQTISKVFVTV